jgi:peptide/nickel transport system ATP-binding protein
VSTTQAAPSTGSGAKQGDLFLRVDNLAVTFPSEDGRVEAVRGLSFDVRRGETLCIVGESGSGKSVTSQAIMGLHKGTKAEVTGEIWLDGQELVSLADRDMRALRGSKMAMIFQDPLSSLHPFYRVGVQLAEAYQVHHDVNKKEAMSRAGDMLDKVGIPSARKRLEDYPFQFSGGMRQRVMIAMALMNDPELLIADEPTTALDVTVQAQILELIKDLQRDFGTAVLLITHDLGVVAEVADEIVVMYGGQCVERGNADEVFYEPKMPYTWGLMTSVPRLDRDLKGSLEPIPGTPPSLINLPSGCVFHARCGYSRFVGGPCWGDAPTLEPTPADSAHMSRCHLPAESRDGLWQARANGEIVPDVLAAPPEAPEPMPAIKTTGSEA